MKSYTEDFMALRRRRRPSIANVHGLALAGGSDIALRCDLLEMAEDATIDYMTTRVGRPDHCDGDLPPRPGVRKTADVHRRPKRWPAGFPLIASTAIRRRQCERSRLLTAHSRH
jgi:enoyl-CoA hydratase/carnithine racemase